MHKALKSTIEHFKINNVNKCCDFIFSNSSNFTKVAINFDNGANITETTQYNDYLINGKGSIHVRRRIHM